MAWLSNNEMWEAFGTRALFWAGTGSDFGEVKTTIERIGTGNLHDWHREWTATAERIETIGDECARRTSGLRPTIGRLTTRCLVRRWSRHLPNRRAASGTQ
jgi:hypothetical protein